MMAPLRRELVAHSTAQAVLNMPNEPSRSAALLSTLQTAGGVLVSLSSELDGLASLEATASSNALGVAVRADAIDRLISSARSSVSDRARSRIRSFTSAHCPNACSRANPIPPTLT